VPLPDRDAPPPTGAGRSVEEPEEVQQDDDEDRHPGEPQDDIAKHEGSLL
jgi:hypothetical protein